MKRREFSILLGGATGSTACPFMSRAQQMPEVGVLGSTTYAGWSKLASAFRQGLSEAGFVDGKNVAIEYRWADGQVDRLPPLAADLVGRRVAAIVPMGGSVAALAAKASTATIPVLFAIGADPVKLGLVESLARPGGNVTGVSFLLNALAPKRLELIRELVPAATTVGLLVNPQNPNARSDTQDVQAAASALGLHLHVVSASNETELAPAFTTLVEQRIIAFLTLPDPFFISRAAAIVALAARHALPAVYTLREDAEAGGLISYGPSISDAHRQLGIYVGRVLKGQKPADLPVMQAVKIGMVVNLKTAKTLGLTFPLSILARADEVIE